MADLLVRIAPATIDRQLKPDRARLAVRGPLPTWLMGQFYTAPGSSAVNSPEPLMS